MSNEERWEPEERKGFHSKVKNAVNQVLLHMRMAKHNDGYYLPPEELHKRLYKKLNGKWAGNYRGGKLKHLKNYRVWMGPREGSDPSDVADDMEQFVKQATTYLRAVRTSRHLVEQTPSDANVRSHINITCNAAAWVMHRLFVIHPFANGNGHTGRALCCWFLWQGGITPRMSIEPRPTDGGYGYGIRAADANDMGPLARYVATTMTDFSWA